MEKCAASSGGSVAAASDGSIAAASGGSNAAASDDLNLVSLAPSSGGSVAAASKDLDLVSLASSSGGSVAAASDGSIAASDDSLDLDELNPLDWKSGNPSMYDFLKTFDEMPSLSVLKAANSLNPLSNSQTDGSESDAPTGTALFDASDAPAGANVCDAYSGIQEPSVSDKIQEDDWVIVIEEPSEAEEEKKNQEDDWVIV